MNALLAMLSLVVAASVVIFVPTYGAAAVALCAVLSFIVGLILSRLEPDKEFLLQVFVAALLLRVVVGTAIFTFNLQEFFGGDAFTYDSLGLMQVKVWRGELSDYAFQAMMGPFLTRNWGMLYVVAGIYGIIGQNMLAVQFVNAILGAATAPVIFLCAKHIFQNRRVATLTTFFVAFYPSLVLWSSQGLKDGLLVFLLALAMLATLKLGERLTLKFLCVLVAALVGILSLRFYIFYIVMASIGTAFVIGMRTLTAQSVLRQFLIIVALGVALVGLGMVKSAGSQLEVYGNLEMLQRSRADLANSAQSGFGKDVDVSTTAGALSAIPIGIIYLLFAPFPWQLASLRQSITLPEMLLWWACFPLLVMGLWFTLKYRLRQSLPILIFSLMLTVAYSMFQGNVGTAYRQRSQLLVFFFIFVSVGYVLMKERREDSRKQAATQKASEAQQMGSQRRAALQVQSDRQRAVELKQRRASFEEERRLALERKRAATEQWLADEKRLAELERGRPRARAELRAEMRECFLTHPAATEADFERCWPDLLDAVLIHHTFEVLAASAHDVSYLLPGGYDGAHGDGYENGNATLHANGNEREGGENGKAKNALALMTRGVGLSPFNRE